MWRTSPRDEEWANMKPSLPRSRIIGRPNGQRCEYGREKKNAFCSKAQATHVLAPEHPTHASLQNIHQFLLYIKVSRISINIKSDTFSTLSFSPSTVQEEARFSQNTFIEAGCGERGNCFYGFVQPSKVEVSHRKVHCLYVEASHSMSINARRGLF